MKLHYEADDTTFSADAYRIPGMRAAWHVLGWETEPDEDTIWTGYEQRTGRVVAVMAGDDVPHYFDPEDLIPISIEDYCPGCGQLDCLHGR